MHQNHRLTQIANVGSWQLSLYYLKKKDSPFDLNALQFFGGLYIKNKQKKRIVLRIFWIYAMAFDKISAKKSNVWSSISLFIRHIFNYRKRTKKDKKLWDRFRKFRIIKNKMKTTLLFPLDTKNSTISLKVKDDRRLKAFYWLTLLQIIKSSH